MQHEVQALAHETSSKKRFGFDALLNRRIGFGFDDSAEEELVPGPEALPDSVKDHSRGLWERIERGAVDEVQACLGRGKHASEAEKERKAQVRLSKHKLLRHIFEHRYYEMCSVVVVGMAVLLTAMDPDTSEALIPQAKIEQSIVEVIFLVIFFLDILLKNLTLGVSNPLCLGSIWGWIDVAVMLSMLTSVIQNALSYAKGVSALPLRVVRLLRCLRPLALIPRMRSARLSPRLPASLPPCLPLAAC